MFPRVFNILLIEDDPLDAIQIKRSLAQSRLKHSLAHASNGEQAQQMLNKSKKTREPLPHFILLDLNMDRMNGLEFLKWLRQDEDLTGITVFILTSSADRTEMARAFEFNIAGYILKPLKHQDLNRSMEKLKEFVEICEFP